MKTSRPVDVRLERLEKTQNYNLSLEASAHDLLATVTSTRRRPTTHRWRLRKRIQVVNSSGEARRQGRSLIGIRREKSEV